MGCRGSIPGARRRFLKLNSLSPAGLRGLVQCRGLLPQRNQLSALLVEVELLDRLDIGAERAHVLPHDFHLLPRQIQLTLGFRTFRNGGGGECRGLVDLANCLNHVGRTSTDQYVQVVGVGSGELGQRRVCCGELADHLAVPVEPLEAVGKLVRHCLADRWQGVAEELVQLVLRELV